MASPRKKSGKPKQQGSSKAKTVLKVLLALLICLIVALFVTERPQWPVAWRNHAAVIAVYNARDVLNAKVKNIVSPPKVPLDVRGTKPKIEQGYSQKDRDKLENLILQEGDTP